MERSLFTPIPDAIAEFKRGNFVIVMDDEDRENEGDLIIAAEHATPEKVAFVIRHTTGILCTALTSERAQQLKLPLMVQNNTDPNHTAFTITVDHKDCSTGVSAVDRSLTIRSLAKPNPTPEEFRRPGHIFPLIAKPGGVLQRRGHTETAVDLCRLAGLTEVGLLAEIQNRDGTMARLAECAALAKEYNIPIITVEQLVQYRKAVDPSPVDVTPQETDYGVKVVAECTLPIKRNSKYLGEWNLRCYHSKFDGEIHSVLIKGSVGGDKPIPVRVHSECFTGNTLGSMRCDCEDQFTYALELVHKRGVGVVIYMGGHEGRGIGLVNKIRAYALQDTQNIDTYKANEVLGFDRDARKYDTAVAILKHLGISKVELLSSNPHKAKALQNMVTKVTPLFTPKTKHNKKYLEDKRAEEAQLASALFSMPLNNKFPVQPSRKSLLGDIGSEYQHLLTRLVLGLVCLCACVFAANSLGCIL